MIRGVTKPVAGPAELTAEEFRWIREFLYRETGIVLNDSKQSLVVGRLNKRLVHFGDRSFRDYFDRITSADHLGEKIVAIDLLTTNETYFFRESKHFDFLARQVVGVTQPAPDFRIWSAASSSGEEAYTAAMVMAEHCRGRWQIVGTDISTRMIERARRGLYPIDAAQKIPAACLRKYCLRGRDEYEGLLLISEPLRRNTEFRHANLLEAWPDLGVFDVVFLRNVMIYFDPPTKKRLIARVRTLLRPGGHLMVSHSESLSGMNDGLQMIAPSIYRNLGT
jgi:chemotaxis protein methyltransferase CheR